MLFSNEPYIHNLHMSKTELSLRTDALTFEYITCVLHSFDLKKYIIDPVDIRTAWICWKQI